MLNINSKQEICDTWKVTHTTDILHYLCTLLPSSDPGNCTAGRSRSHLDWRIVTFCAWDDVMRWSSCRSSFSVSMMITTRQQRWAQTLILLCVWESVCARVCVWQYMKIHQTVNTEHMKTHRERRQTTAKWKERCQTFPATGKLRGITKVFI